MVKLTGQGWVKEMDWYADERDLMHREALGVVAGTRSSLMHELRYLEDENNRRERERVLAHLSAVLQSLHQAMAAAGEQPVGVDSSYWPSKGRSHV